MKLLFLRLKFQLLRKFNDGEPSRAEVVWALEHVSLTMRIMSVMLMYSEGENYDTIATHHGVTRERVRQLIQKGVRDAWATKIKKKSNEYEY